VACVWQRCELRSHTSNCRFSYVDTDYEALQSIDPHVALHKAFVCEEDEVSDTLWHASISPAPPFLFTHRTLKPCCCSPHPANPLLRAS
jgi:hypothetical protein